MLTIRAMGGAEKWMTTGVVGSDGFGTNQVQSTLMQSLLAFIKLEKYHQFLAFK